MTDTPHRMISRVEEPGSAHFSKQIWVLAPGTYWVGDPGYAFDDRALWIALLESANYKDHPRVLNAVISNDQDFMFCATNTEFGDGTYFDSDGREYPVDAGLLGVVPDAHIKTSPFGMHLIEFTEEFTVSRDGDGVVHIGPIDIDTDPAEEDE